ncbi:MAG TPA: hypothetical protein VGS08_02155 [Candidatus Saccharimonadales bacterium]|nr:hypothetical protein [Candidatus Saccharimonadales bacterium]
MLTRLIGIACLLVALITLILQSFYRALPEKEMKRRAAAGEPSARLAYRVVAYGPSLSVLLWGIVGLSLAVGSVLLARNESVWVALPVLLLVFGACAGIVSFHIRWERAGFIAKTAPMLDLVLRYTNPLLCQVSALLPMTSISRRDLYEREDLEELLSQQAAQADSRIDPDELELLWRALRFSEARALDIATPRKDTRALSTSDVVGPVLLDELHSHDQAYCPVYRGEPDNVVGTLAVAQAARSQKSERASDIMEKHLCFVHEDFRLPQVAHAFVASGQQVAIVINKFEEFVGIISFQQLMNFLFQMQPADQLRSEQYADRTAVAGYNLYPPAGPVALTPHGEVISPESSEVVE